MLSVVEFLMAVAAVGGGQQDDDNNDDEDGGNCHLTTINYNCDDGNSIGGKGGGDGDGAER